MWAAPLARWACPYPCHWGRRRHGLVLRWGCIDYQCPVHPYCLARKAGEVLLARKAGEVP